MTIRVPVLLGLVLAAAAPAAAGDLVTTQPLETVQHCIVERWAGTGKMIAINTAAGVTLDLAFSAVAADGKVGLGHVAFAVEDRGTQRRLTATAPDRADAALAEQMLHETAKACLHEGGDGAASRPERLARIAKASDSDAKTR